MKRLFNCLREHEFFIKEKDSEFFFEVKEGETLTSANIYVSKVEGRPLQWGFASYKNDEVIFSPPFIKDTPEWFLRLFKLAEKDSKKFNDFKKIFE